MSTYTNSSDIEGSKVIDLAAMRICEQGRGRKRGPKSGRSGRMKEFV